MKLQEMYGQIGGNFIEANGKATGCIKVKTLSVGESNDDIMLIYPWIGFYVDINQTLPMNALAVLKICNPQNW